MAERRAWTALGAGSLPLIVVLWAFFAGLLPVEAPRVAHPWRASIPFAVVLFTGLGLGAAYPDDGVRLGVLAALPGLIVGGGLAILAALSLRDLFLTAVLAAGFVLFSTFGAWLGGWVRARL